MSYILTKPYKMHGKAAVQSKGQRPNLFDTLSGYPALFAYFPQKARITKRDENEKALPQKHLFRLDLAITSPDGSLLMKNKPEETHYERSVADLRRLL